MPRVSINQQSFVCRESFLSVRHQCMTKQNFTTPIKADDGKASSLSGPFPLFSLVFDHHRQLLKLQASAKLTHFHCHRILTLLSGEAAAMDFDFRASSILSARHCSAVQAARLHSDNYSVFYESDGDDDARSYFPCPFCYVEIEVPGLCSHLQEEHCFDLKNAVCPVCAANLGKDPIGHFITQHSSSLKRRRKPEKSTIWSGNSAMLRKKLVTNGRGNKHESTTDPLLSPFICNVSVPDPNNAHQDEDNALIISDAKRSGADEREVGNEEDHQERRQRAAFVQQLVASTIF